MGYLIKRASTARPLVFLMIDSVAHIDGKTGLTPTVTISKNGAAFASPAGAVTELSGGWYKVAANVTDSGTLGVLLLHATAVGADPCDTSFEVVEFDPDTVAVGANTIAPLTTLGATAPAGWINAAAIASSAFSSAKFATGAITSATFAAGAFDAVWAVAARVITGTVTLDATQGSYAPAKAGDAMTLTSGERTAVANATEAAIFNDGDATALLTAIGNTVEQFLLNDGDAQATLAAIASAVRTNLAAELARIDATISSRSTQTSVDVVDGVVDAILLDSNELQFNQADWATATGFSTHSAGDVNDAVEAGQVGIDAAAAKAAAESVDTKIDDVPTNAELAAAFTEVKGATWDSGNDTLEDIRNASGGGSGGLTTEQDEALTRIDANTTFTYSNDIGTVYLDTSDVTTREIEWSSDDATLVVTQWDGDSWEATTADAPVYDRQEGSLYKYEWSHLDDTSGVGLYRFKVTDGADTKYFGVHIGDVGLVWTKRNAVILSGLVTGAATGTEVFTISSLGITGTVVVDADGNRSSVTWS